MNSSSIQHIDVLIIGAGISGIGAAYYLQAMQPGKSFAILEARDEIGGTWDLFRYPGIRSDSDLHTFSYEFKAWENEKAIASAGAIMAYLRETVSENGIGQSIRFHHKVISAAWSTKDARWLVEIERHDTGEHITMSCGWLFCASGYYRYDECFTPEFPGQERFTGQIVHPQHWPEDLDYRGKRVVIIGGGATAVTLVPAMAETAGHVTMLQRSPTYIVPVPSEDRLANTLPKLIGRDRAYAVTRHKNIARQRLIWRFCQQHPRAARRLIRHLWCANTSAGCWPTWTLTATPSATRSCRREYRPGHCWTSPPVTSGEQWVSSRVRALKSLGAPAWITAPTKRCCAMVRSTTTTCASPGRLLRRH